MIKLTDTEGNTAYVVAEHVFALEQGRSDSTMITSHGGQVIQVRESLDDVAAMVALETGDMVNEEWLDSPHNGI